MAKKTGKGDDATFWNASAGISNCRASIEMTFLESKDRAWQNKNVFKLKLCFPNLALLALTSPDFGWNVKISVTIDFYVPKDP